MKLTMGGVAQGQDVSREVRGSTALAAVEHIKALSTAVSGAVGVSEEVLRGGGVEQG